MRSFRLLRVLALIAGLARAATVHAQLDAPPEAPLPPPPTPQPVNPLTEPTPKRLPYQTRVFGHRPSPEWTQDRSFTSTRFWLLDPGNYEVQTWLRTRVFPEVGGTRAPAELLWQHEIEIGLVPHVQLDIYENVTINVEDDGVRRLQQEGNQLEVRIAIPSYYGQIFGNPVIYLEWHPRHNQPDRAEARLLLGGAPTRWLYLAFNPYVETNVEATDSFDAAVDPATMKPTLVKHSKYIADMEFGTTAAAGFRITDRFRVSAELKIGADMLGDENNKLHFVFFAGPGLIWKPLPQPYSKYLKIMATCLFAIPPTPSDAQQLEPLVIIGSQF